MSAADRRRRQRAASTGTPGQAQPQPAQFTPVVTPMPEWKWRTFPVLFALSAGLFFGIWVGWATGFIAGADDNTTPTNIVFIAAALPFGAVLSRFATRFMMSRQWIKPKPAKPAKKR
ncbi:MAG: hypothetical protein IT303_03695 [Dehalococcoidia bacterium]|nr:hypothetical protein [Dehalococcoidia bacterium]